MYKKYSMQGLHETPQVVLALEKGRICFKEKIYTVARMNVLQLFLWDGFLNPQMASLHGSLLLMHA